VNKTQELSERGFAPIMLTADGQPVPSPENRISMGSRGDSFYEYLVKDWVFSGLKEDAPARRLWVSFLGALPGLFVEADPEYAAERLRRRAQRRRKKRKRRSWRVSWRRRLLRADSIAEAALSGILPGRRRRSLQRSAGRLGGWYESELDVASPWVFLKEVTFSKSIPKMDHLICFLPGALALDVYNRRKLSRGVDADSSNADGMHIAHKLLETCVHMYFRTATDMAPEITRFNGFGMRDDLGSMHNILRPETVESLTLLWRASKGQVYRNWGQRLLAAFGRQRTEYGYASLDNVNRPDSHKDSMPSFFLAETVKYLFLLFSADDALPWDDVVLNTEAHPLPVAQSEVAWWPCGDLPEKQEPSGRTKRHLRRRWRKRGRKRKQDMATPQPEVGEIIKVIIDNRNGGLGVRLSRGEHKEYAVKNITAGGAIETWNWFYPERQVNIGNTVVSVNGVSGPDLLAEARRRQWLVLKIRRPEQVAEQEEPPAAPTPAPPKFPSTRARPAQPQILKGLLTVPANITYLTEMPPTRRANDPALGNQACWTGGFSFELCCFPRPGGNPLCWDSLFTYARCCAT